VRVRVGNHGTRRDAHFRLPPPPPPVHDGSGASRLRCSAPAGPAASSPWRTCSLSSSRATPSGRGRRRSPPSPTTPPPPRQREELRDRATGRQRALHQGDGRDLLHPGAPNPPGDD
jgi:hypothetical protein